MKKISRNISLREVYENKKTEPTPASAFINWLAALTGRSCATVRQWIYGTQRPDVDVQIKISDALNIPVKYLFPQNTSL